MSCSTKASRSAGCNVSSTTSSAAPTESAISASRARVSSTGSGTCGPIGSSRRDLRGAQHVEQMRATTVVSQPRRLATSVVSLRLTRSQASCTASSTSARDPSIR